MSGGFNVEESALRAYAAAVDAAASRIDGIRSRTRHLDLTQETFGRLPQSDELKADYDSQRSESGDDLQGAVETLNSIAEALRGSAEAYDATEMDNTHVVGGGN